MKHPNAKFHDAAGAIAATAPNDDDGTLLGMIIYYAIEQGNEWGDILMMTTSVFQGGFSRGTVKEMVRVLFKGNVPVDLKQAWDIWEANFVPISDEEMEAKIAKHNGPKRTRKRKKPASSWPLRAKANRRRHETTTAGALKAPAVGTGGPPDYLTT